MNKISAEKNDRIFILPSSNPGKIEEAPYPAVNTSLGESVRQAMKKRYGNNVSSILLQENKEKYYDVSSPNESNKDLQEVFQLMRSLNHQALKDPDLGKTRLKPHSFLDTLAATVDGIIENHATLPIQYVELGPEPVKTSFILRQLLKRGVRIDSYTGVDINPASSPEMKAALEHILRPEQIGYRTLSFDQFRAESIRRPDTQILVTMLGFQEGNEDPEIMSSWLNPMMGKDDLLLSEMQLNPEQEGPQIAAFYQNPLMRRFSKIAFSRVFGDIPSEYRASLLPVTLNDGKTVQAIVMCETFRKEGSGKEELLVTNYCLKYSKQQFQHYRECNETFKILEEFYIGDQTVVFQLSQRQ